MIYLIDDDLHHRIPNYGFNFEDESSSCFGKISHVKKLLIKPDITDVSELRFLDNATAILLHASFYDVSESGEVVNGSTSNVTKIKESIAEFGLKIPLVIFSNGVDGVTYRPLRSPNYIMGINKDLFYERLHFFLDVYSKTNVIDLRFLAFTKQEIVQKMKKIATEINNKLLNQGDDKLLNLDDLLEVDALHDFLKFSMISHDTDTFIEQNIARLMTKDDLLQHIKFTFNRFKDDNNPVYHWQ